MHHSTATHDQHCFCAQRGQHLADAVQIFRCDLPRDKYCDNRSFGNRVHQPPWNPNSVIEDALCGDVWLPPAFTERSGDPPSQLRRAWSIVGQLEQFGSKPTEVVNRVISCCRCDAKCRGASPMCGNCDNRTRTDAASELSQSVLLRSALHGHHGRAMRNEDRRHSRVGVGGFHSAPTSQSWQWKPHQRSVGRSVQTSLPPSGEFPCRNPNRLCRCGGTG